MIVLIIIAYLTIGVIMFICEKREKRIKHLSVSVETVVHDVLEWSYKKFPSKRLNRISVNLVYLPAKFKVLGTYDPLDCLITLYVYPSLEVGELVDTILHEYRHHLDLSGKDFEPKRSRIFQTLSRRYDPIEVSAKRFARRNRDACLRFFKKKWF